MNETKNDTIVKALSFDGSIRIYAAQTTGLVNVAQQTHHTYPIPTAALGRTLTAAAIMGAMMKGDNESVTIQIKGDGPMGGLTVVGNSKSEVKGYVNVPDVHLESAKPGKLNVGGAIGKGTLSIMRDLGLKEPYIGQVPLVNGEIAEDLTYYYASSEQIPTAIALGVLVEPDGSVSHSGGFILQLMPEASEADAEKLENIMKTLPPVTDMLKSGMSSEDILLKATEGFNMLIDNHHITPEYACNCSRSKMEKALISLGKKELRAIIEEQGQAELNCHFCNNKHLFTKSDLERLIKSI